MKDWIITFNDGSRATYYNTTSVQAVNLAVRDWYPHKQPVAWHETSVDVFSIPLD